MATAAVLPSAGFEGAIDFLEQVFLRASSSRYGYRLERWIDPKVTDREYIAARDSVISDVIQSGAVPIEGLNAKRDYYDQQIQRFVPVVGKAARTWTLTNLNRQTHAIYRLVITTRPRIDALHTAARAVRRTVDADTFVLPTMTSDEAREATGETRTGERRTASAIVERLRRLSYMYALRSGPVVPPKTKPKPEQVAAYSNLLSLMAHPRGVDILDAFAKAPKKGWDLTSELFSESLVSIVELQGKLATDEDLVWRFPPAIAAGVASLGLKNRTGITQFALAWGASRKTKLEEALEIAGNALFVLDLAGGPLGAAVSEVISFVLEVIGSAVSFLRDVEQDQAAASTAFAARSERLSHGSNKLGTILQGVAAVTVGLLVSGSVLRKIVGERRPPIRRGAPAPQRTSPSPPVADARAVANKQKVRTTAEELDRAVGAKRATSRGTGNSPTATPVREYEMCDH